MTKQENAMRSAVLSDNYQVIRQYIRKGSGQKIGMLVAFKDLDEDFIRIGWSQCNSKERFDTRKAFTIAVGRACKGTILVDRRADHFGHKISVEFPEYRRSRIQLLRFIHRSQKYFKFTS